MPEFLRVASVSEVPPGEMMMVEVEGQEVVLANLDGDIVAFGNECTHRGGPLGEGILMGDVVECPWHSGQFNVRSGEVVGSPPDSPMRTYEVRVEGDDVSVAKG
jgi:nitrite reductase/ring-hydroxylating ferredoxin subunit